jgi:hypothetical protein
MNVPEGLGFDPNYCLKLKKTCNMRTAKNKRKHISEV